MAGDLRTRASIRAASNGGCGSSRWSGLVDSKAHESGRIISMSAITLKACMPGSLTDSPLLVRRFPIQFDAVKAEDVEPAVQLLLQQMRERLVDLGSSSHPRTYEHVLMRLDKMTEP